MNLFERINKQLLVQCQYGKVDWEQAWYNVIPEGATIPYRTEEEQECYDMAMNIVCSYALRKKVDPLCLSFDKQCGEAVYNWDKDRIDIPCRLQFDCDADFFCTLFHELVHSTGAPKRLNRPGFNVNRTAGDYCEEELIAELGSMYLCGICCYNSGKVFDQSASYIRSYKHETNASDDDLMEIAKKALKAVDYILGENP